MNSPVNDACPQCGSAAAVHSVAELATFAQARLGQQPGFAAPPQSGYAAEPQPGPVPGYAAEPRSGPVPGPRPGAGWRPSLSSGSPASPEDEIAAAALGAAARFIGRSIGRRVQRAMDQQVLPALAARQQAAMRAQIEIAERHPDLRACLTDEVIFLAGGSRVLPLADVTGTPTVELADALVARLRDG